VPLSCGYVPVWIDSCGLVALLPLTACWWWSPVSPSLGDCVWWSGQDPGPAVGPVTGPRCWPWLTGR